MKQSAQYNPFRGIKEANKNDHYPNSLAESNALFSKYWLQGFFSVVGERHQDSWLVKEEEKDGKDNLVWNTEAPLMLVCSDVYLNLLAQLAHDDIDVDEQSHVGLADFLNLLYWAAIPLITYDLNLLEITFARGSNFGWGHRLISGLVGILLLPIMLAIALPAVATSFLWTAIKIVVAAVSVTLTSGIWYGAKLIQLHEKEKGWEDMPIYDGESIPEGPTT